MSTVALKISIDGCKYLIKGIGKETSHKDVLCAIAKYRNVQRDDNNLNSLSTSIGSFSIIECFETKKSKKKGKSLSSDCELKRESSQRRKTKAEGNKRKEQFGKKCKDRESENANEKKESKKEAKHSNKKQSELLRSYSLNDKDRRKYKRKLKQLSCADDSDIEKLQSRQRKFKNSLNKRNYDDDDINTFYKLHNLISTQNIEIKAQIKSMNKSEWLDNLKRHSTTYFIEDERITEDRNKIGQNKDNLSNETLGSKGRCEISTNGNFEKCSKKPSETISDCTEIDNDSGLPSIEYESSLDTVSRDEISLQFDQENSDRTSINEATDVGREVNCLLDDVFVDEEDNLVDGQQIEGRNEESGTDAFESRNLELMTEIKGLFKDLSETIDDLSFKELMIAQLEFQLDCLAEDENDYDENETETEETNLITDLKQTQEFLKAVTCLCQYQKREHLKISNELNYLNQVINKRRTKLSLLQRKVSQAEFSFLPRHLKVSEQRRTKVVIINETPEEINNNDEELHESSVTETNQRFELKQDYNDNEAVSLV